MPLPTPLRDFVYAFETLAARSVRTPWGVVVTDPRFPDVYDANKACVLEAAPGVTVEAIREALTPELDAAGIRFEHIELMDLDDETPAREALTRSASRVHPDAVMVHAGRLSQIRAVAGAITINELEEPDEAFWRVYRESRNEFGVTMPDDVVDQLVRRDREVLTAAGLRFFAGSSEGEVVGFTTLLSIGGVGYLDNVVTLRAYRRMGVASATVMKAVGASRDAGDGQTFLLTDLQGTARSLYERLGFRLVCRAAGFTNARLAH